MKITTRQSGLVLIAFLSWGGALALSGTIGYYSKNVVPDLVLQVVFKYLTGVVAITWVFSYSVYTKLVDITDAPGLDYQQHRSLESIVKVKIRKFWINAIILGFIGVLLNIPSILQEAKIPVPSLVYSLTFMALVLCFSFLLNSWGQLEEIRQLKSKLREDQRREDLRTQQLKNLPPSAGKDWENDPKLDGFRNSSP